MRSKPCDELGANLATAQLQWGCRLDSQVAECLIEYVSSKYPSRDFEVLLELALDLQAVTEDNERHAYKMALGLFFSTRVQYARRQAKQQAKEMDAVPFAPR